MAHRVDTQAAPEQGEVSLASATRSDMGQPLARRACEIVGSLARGLCLLSGILMLLAMGAVTCVDVVMRQFGYGIPGNWEAVTLAMRWVIALALPYAFYSGSHIAVELFTDWLPPRWRQLVIVVMTAVTLAVITLLAWKVVGRTLDTKGYGGVTSDLGLPTYFDWVPLAVGPVLSVPVLLALLWREITVWLSLFRAPRSEVRS